MAVKARAVLTTRKGEYLFLRMFNDAIWVINQAQPETIVIRASGKSLSENFFDAVKEIHDVILPSEIVTLALVLGVQLPDNVVIDLLGCDKIIEAVAHALGLDLEGNY